MLGEVVVVVVVVVVFVLVFLTFATGETLIGRFRKWHQLARKQSRRMGMDPP